MKNIALLIITIISCCSLSKASGETKSYRTVSSGVLFSEWDIAENELISKIFIPGGSKFSIVQEEIIEESKFYIIRFNNWQKPSVDEEKEMYNQIGSSASIEEISTAALTEVNKHNYYKYNINPVSKEQRYFRISQSELDDYAVEIYSLLAPAYGVMTLPLKLRQNGDFSKDLSVSALGGLKWRPYRTDRFNIALVTGLGLASVTLDSDNTNGEILESTERSAVSIPLGLVFEFERLQFGFLTGWDKLSRKDRDEWIYQDKPWFSFGFGFAIFSQQQEAASSTSLNN